MNKKGLRLMGLVLAGFVSVNSTVNFGSLTVKAESVELEATQEITSEEIVVENSMAAVTPGTLGGMLEASDINDINNWQSGYYKNKTLAYNANANYLCLSEFKSIAAGNIFTAVIPEGFTFTVIEMNEAMEYIRLVDVSNNQAYTARMDAAYLAISIKTTDGSKIGYNEFAELFANNEIDLVPALTAKDMEENKNLFDVMTDNEGLEATDFSDFNNWQTGSYEHQTLAHVFNINRACLKKFKAVEAAATYKVTVPENYTMTIRELDNAGNFIKSVTVKNEKEYKAGQNAAYAALFVNESNNAKVGFDACKEAATQIKVEKEVKETEVKEEIKEEVIEETPIVEAIVEEAPVVEVDDFEDIAEDEEVKEALIKELEDTSIIENCDLSDMRNWVSGTYNYQTGALTGNGKRICVSEMKKYIVGDTFNVTLPEGFIMVVREANAKMERVGNKTLSNATVYTPSASAVYLAITVYKKDNSAVSYAQYSQYITTGKIQFTSNRKVVSLAKISDGNVAVNLNDTTILDNVDLSKQSAWKKGAYIHSSEEYDETVIALTLKNKKHVIAGYEYTANLPEGYKFLITEFDEAGNYIGTVNVYNGGVYSPEKLVAQAAITIETVDGSATTFKNLKEIVTTNSANFAINA